MNKTTLVLALMTLSASAAYADYQFEVGAEIGSQFVEQDYDVELERDLEENITTEHVAVEATMFLSPVTTTGGPLAEAAFVGKASGISIGFVRDDIETENNLNDIEYDEDSDLNALSGRFVVPAGIDLIIDAGLGKGEDDDVDVDIRMLGLGAYLTASSTLVLGYRDYEFDFDGFEATTEIWQLSYRQLITLDGGMALAIEPHYAMYDFEDDTDANELGLRATLYTSRQLGIYLDVEGYAIEDNDPEDAEYSRSSTALGISYFVNEQLRIGAELKGIYGEGEFYDEDFGDIDQEISGSAISLNIAARF